MNVGDRRESKEAVYSDSAVGQAWLLTGTGLRQADCFATMRFSVVHHCCSLLQCTYNEFNQNLYQTNLTCRRDGKRYKAILLITGFCPLTRTYTHNVDFNYTSEGREKARCSIISITAPSLICFPTPPEPEKKGEFA